MKIVFLHGLESSPNSTKVTFLRGRGHEVLAPRLDKTDWEQSVLAARSAIDEFGPDVVVGSSRGGAVAMAAHTRTPMVLIAPAWKKYAPWATTPGNAIILHSSLDEVVAFADSKELVRSFGARLFDVGDSHFMSDDDALWALLEVIEDRNVPWSRTND